MLSLKPRVRGGFSDRTKKEPINTIIQKDALDERTRNKIINIFDVIIYNCDRRYITNEFYDYIYKTVFCVTQDEIPYNERQPIIDGIKNNWKYYDVLSFIEEVVIWCNKKFYEDLTETFNDLFKEECVGYRFIDNKITDIINNEEIKEIEEALDTKYSACNESINKALNLLYNREKPDYSNSVKESISAIESMCNIILGTKNATLGEALKKLEKNGFEIHSAMKNAFVSLYGYTSDKSGIRHNNGVDENTTFEEAKYMLVSCSAFLNYLIQIYEKK